MMTMVKRDNSRLHLYNLLRGKKYLELSIDRYSIGFVEMTY